LNRGLDATCGTNLQHAGFHFNALPPDTQVRVPVLALYLFALTLALHNRAAIKMPRYFGRSQL
jgi:hypothetical protein